MGCFKLKAIGDHAKQLTDICNGAPDLLLWTNRPVLLGRGVRDGEGYKYPNAWNSLSSRHCTLTYTDGSEEGKGHWVVKDTSTNGTYINGVKIGKENISVLSIGDRLGLSIVQPPANTNATFVNTVEYELEYNPEGLEPNPAAQQQASSLKRRSQEVIQSSPGIAAATKKQRLDAETAELLQLRNTNQDLRRQNDQYRSQLDQLEQQLQAAQADKATAAQQHVEQLQALQDRLRTEAAASAATMEAELAAERERADHMSKQLEEVTAAASQKEADLATQLASAQAQLHEQQQEAAQLKQYVDHQVEQLTDLETQVAQLQSELEQRQATATIAQTAAAALQQQLSVIQAELGQKQQQLDAEVNAKRVVVANAVEAKRRATAAERVSVALREKLEGEKEQMIVYNKQVVQVHQQLQEQQAVVSKQAQETQTRITALGTLLTQLSSRYRDQQATVAAVFDDIGTQLGQLAVEGRVATLTDPAAAAAAAGGGVVGGSMRLDGGHASQADGRTTGQQEQEHVPGSQTTMDNRSAVALTGDATDATDDEADQQQPQFEEPMTQPLDAGPAAAYGAAASPAKHAAIMQSPYATPAPMATLAVQPESMPMIVRPGEAAAAATAMQGTPVFAAQGTPAAILGAQEGDPYMHSRGFGSRQGPSLAQPVEHTQDMAGPAGYGESGPLLLTALIGHTGTDSSHGAAIAGIATGAQQQPGQRHKDAAANNADKGDEGAKGSEGEGDDDTDMEEQEEEQKGGKAIHATRATRSQAATAAGDDEGMDVEDHMTAAGLEQLLPAEAAADGPGGAVTVHQSYNGNEPQQLMDHTNLQHNDAAALIYQQPMQQQGADNGQAEQQEQQRIPPSQDDNMQRQQPLLDADNGMQDNAAKPDSQELGPTDSSPASKHRERHGEGSQQIGAQLGGPDLQGNGAGAVGKAVAVDSDDRVGIAAEALVDILSQQNSQPQQQQAAGDDVAGAKGASRQGVSAQGVQRGSSGARQLLGSEVWAPAWRKENVGS